MLPPSSVATRFMLLRLSVRSSQSCCDVSPLGHFETLNPLQLGCWQLANLAMLIPFPNGGAPDRQLLDALSESSVTCLPNLPSRLPVGSCRIPEIQSAQ